MGESLKGFISTELFFFKNVTYDAKNSLLCEAAKNGATPTTELR